MRQYMTRGFILATSALLLATLTGCDKLVDTSNAAASVTQKAFTDSRDTWRDVFTYHPKAAPQMPQTRYCYQVQTDITCYDSLQPNQTAKLIGYQDGENLSWVQPGGGSLGASGGQPMSYKNVAANSNPAGPLTPVAPVQVSTVDVPQSGSIMSTNLPPSTVR